MPGCKISAPAWRSHHRCPVARKTAVISIMGPTEFTRIPEWEVHAKGRWSTVDLRCLSLLCCTAGDADKAGALAQGHLGSLGKLQGPEFILRPSTALPPLILSFAGCRTAGSRGHRKVPLADSGVRRRFLLCCMRGSCQPLADRTTAACNSAKHDRREKGAKHSVQAEHLCLRRMSTLHST